MTTLFTCVCLAVALSAGNEEFERTAVNGAAEIAVARLKDEAIREPQAEGVLRDIMLADPGRYARREEAQKAGEDVYAEAVVRGLSQRVDATLARLAGSQHPEDVFGTNFVAAARTLSVPERTRLLSGIYTNVFERERRAACEAQAAVLVADVRPSMSVVDSDDEKAVRAALTANITARGGQGVFEENLLYISEKLVGPMLEDAKREKRRQGEYVRRVRADRASPQALRDDIAWKLVENVRERAAKTENAALRWEVFPSVTNRTLDAAVEQRVLGRFAAKIEELKLSFDEQAVRDAYAADPEAHRTAAASRQALRTAAGAKLLAAARADVLADAPPAERTELATYADARMTNRLITKSLERKLAAELDPLVARVRAEAAEREFAAVWPTLADRTWYPSADLADDISLRSDFTTAVRAWRRLPEMNKLDLHGVFEEADARADAAVASSFELARAAVVGQTKTVDEVHGAVLAESRERKESFFSRTPDLKAIVKMLTEATLTRWNEHKNAVLWPEAELPSNASEQHAELFPSVRKRIELVAKEILEEMQKPEPEEKPEEPKPETPPEETPPEEPKLEFSILVSQQGNRISIQLEQSGKKLVEETVEARQAPFESAIRTVADKLGREILQLK